MKYLSNNDNSNLFIASNVLQVPVEPGLYITTANNVTLYFGYDNPLKMWDRQASCLMLKLIDERRIYIPWHFIQEIMVVPTHAEMPQDERQ